MNVFVALGILGALFLALILYAAFLLGGLCEMYRFRSKLSPNEYDRFEL